MRISFFNSVLIIALFFSGCSQSPEIIWQIGDADNSAMEFALAPDNYEEFLDNDFGWEDKFFLIGFSDEKEDWPYVLPGPSDQWGGTWGTAGWRSHTLNILFGIDKLPRKGNWKLVVDLKENHKDNPPVFKVTVNGKPWKFMLPAGSENEIKEAMKNDSAGYLIEIPVPAEFIQQGGNEINLTTLQGSWLLFDQIRLEGPGKAVLKNNDRVFVRNVEPAEYETEVNGKQMQPLLVDVQHLSENPKIKIMLDGNNIFEETLESGRYIFEAPMPAVENTQKSNYEILIDGKLMEEGKVQRKSFDRISAADYADTKMGTAHSRWM
ncbi:MAG TPA: polysaccharide lyase family protein, partial [Tangfeifania sp.]|nr:polysaccharide lyase family protein [Tangfeifania sp.]